MNFNDSIESKEKERIITVVFYIQLNLNLVDTLKCVQIYIWIIYKINKRNYSVIKQTPTSFKI